MRLLFVFLFLRAFFSFLGTVLRMLWGLMVSLFYFLKSLMVPTTEERLRHLDPPNQPGK